MQGKNRRESASLYQINEHSEPVFNTVEAPQIVFKRPVKAGRSNAPTAVAVPNGV